MEKSPLKQKPGKNAQAIIELAVFGAVLIYLIAGIAMNFVGASSQQHSQLAAMRTALLKSYHASNNNDTSRSQASYTLLEDRLTGDFGKYGSMDRQPINAAGSGMLSMQLMQPVDFQDGHNLPVVDLKINGQDFVMTSAAFVTYVIVKGPPTRIWKLPPGQKGPKDPAKPTEPAKPFNCDHIKYVAQYGTESTDYFEKRAAARLGREWVIDKAVDDKQDMPFLYRIIVSNDVDFPTDSTNEKAFDYTRDGDSTNDLPVVKRSDAFWRWTWDSQDAVIKKIDKDNGSFPMYDVDGDLKEETVYSIMTCCNKGSEDAYIVDVLDPNLGDVDFSRLPIEYDKPSDRGGLLQDMRMNTKTRCVPADGDALGDGTCTGTDNLTSLEIDEGRLYSSNGLMPVSVSRVKRNEYDIVERVYQMNPNMYIVDEADVNSFYNRNKAVLEAYCKEKDCCMSEAYVTQTCFDAGIKRLYIRSRISDMRGRKWMTKSDQTWKESLGAGK